MGPQKTEAYLFQEERRGAVYGRMLQKELLAEIKRILKPQGILHVNDFLLNTDERNLLRYDNYKDTVNVKELEKRI